MLPGLGRFILAIGFIFALGIPARAFESTADYALVMDAETGVVLYEKNCRCAHLPGEHEQAHDRADGF